MAGRIFVNYRRDDDPSAAARIRDGLAAKFGTQNVFMDVDNLLAGQRFDEALAKALAECDVVIAIVGARWMELLKTRGASGGYDYVRQEVAEALRRKLVVIPVRVGREGTLPPLPRVDELPRDIRDVVFHQKHDVTHERFGRDMAELIEAITTIRKTHAPQQVAPRALRGWIGAVAVGLFLIGYGAAYYAGARVPWPSTPAGGTRDEQRAKAPNRAPEEQVARRVPQEENKPPVPKPNARATQEPGTGAPPSAPIRRSREEIRDNLYRAIMEQLTRTRATRDEAQNVAENYRAAPSPKAMAVCIDWEKTTPSVLNAGAKSGAYNGRADEACHSLSGEQCGRYTYNKCRDRGCRVTGQQCVLVDVNGRNALTLDEAWAKKFAR